jgi:hypothetical protein
MKKVSSGERGIILPASLPYENEVGQKEQDGKEMNGV